MKLELAKSLAEELVYMLGPYCERIEAAGGIRRKKPEPHDIELVAIPRMRAHVVTTPLGTEIDSGPVNALDERMHLLDTLGTIQRGDPSETTRKSKVFGTEKVLIKALFGEKLYRVKYKGEKVNLFVVTPPAQWGPVFAIRTGDKDYSHWLVQQGYPRGIHEDRGHLERWVHEGYETLESRRRPLPTPLSSGGRSYRRPRRRTSSRRSASPA